MRNATYIFSGLGVDLVVSGIVRHFECVSALVNFCRENNITALPIK